MLSDAFASHTSQNERERNDAWVGQIQRGEFDLEETAASGIQPYEKGLILGDEDFCRAFYTALGEYFDWAKEMLTSKGIIWDETLDITREVE